MTITNSLLKVSVRRRISFPMNGIGRVGMCPVGFRRFLLTGKRKRLIGLLGTGSFGALTIVRSHLLSLLHRCCCIKKLPRTIGGCIRASTLVRMEHVRGRVLRNCRLSFSGRTPGRRLRHVELI